MNRRARLDVAIVGGGVVGAACALALADAGHMLHHDQPHALAALIEDFLAP